MSLPLFFMCDPQTLVGEVHRRVLVEYVRAVMRGRIMCTSSKMRKRMAFRMQEEAKQLKGLFKDLVSLNSYQLLLLGGWWGEIKVLLTVNPG